MAVRELGGADSKSRIIVLKSDPKNPFFGKVGPEKSKLFVLLENGHMGYLEDVDSYCDIIFLNFQP